MFETTTSDGVPMMVRVSFWQCLKAGAAFAIGAAAIEAILRVLGLLTFLGALGALAQALGHR